MALVGNLRDFGLSEFLYLVDRGYKTGRLTLQKPGDRAELNKGFTAGDENAFLAFVKECFAQKRKTLRNNLRGRLGDRVMRLLSDAGIPEGARAEELTISQFVQLFRVASH